MAALLKGAPVAASLNEKSKARAAELRKRGVIPTLALVRAGDSSADISYERGAMKRCASSVSDISSEKRATGTP